MKFSEFAKKMYSVLGGKSSEELTRLILTSIVTEKGKQYIDTLADSTIKRYFNGSLSITNLSKKINIYVDTTLFAQFIDDLGDHVTTRLAEAFADDIPQIDKTNVGDVLAEEFVSIITHAASGSFFNNILVDYSETVSKDNNLNDIDFNAHMRALMKDKNVPFAYYVGEAMDFYSERKTLLFRDQPIPFYDMHVCNDIQCSGAERINNPDIYSLRLTSNYVILEGTGGIGKSMLLNHFFLKLADKYSTDEYVPVFLSLKDYDDPQMSIIDFVLKEINSFDPDIKIEDIVEEAQKQNLIILLDGYDEIRSSLRDPFEKELDMFIKSYPKNCVIMSSRPINSFISFSKFVIFEVLPLTKLQAIELVKKLDYLDEADQNKFLESFENELYDTHKEFAGNPLLLSIMLMTYSFFGEIPQRIHVFYSKAYETMARIHDASKGGFKRHLYTGLSPEVFAKYFAQFCARTYSKEILEFDKSLFEKYMNLVIEDKKLFNENITPSNFLLDLTENLCLMYCEGEKYYFIHRSFQEYFTAKYFSEVDDNRLKNVGKHFEDKDNRAYTDKTFDMLYDMIPEKVERYIFLPFLQELFDDCSSEKDEDAYWNFLVKIHPWIYYNEGKRNRDEHTETKSFLYSKLVSFNGLDLTYEIDKFAWPQQTYTLPTIRRWFFAYPNFLDSEEIAKYQTVDEVDKSLMEDIVLVAIEDVPKSYFSLFGKPEIQGMSIEIDVEDLLHNSHKYKELKSAIESSDFPLMKEYQLIKEHFRSLREEAERSANSNSLF